MKHPTVTLEVQDRLAVVTLNRPERHNAFHEEMWGAFTRTTEKLRRHPPRVIVLTGAGEKAFSAGFDVNPQNPQVANLVGAVEKRDRETIGGFIRYLQGAIRAFTSLPVPVIAALNGMAYGGGAELAVQCDLRVMDESAVFCFSETRLGLMPDWGGGVALTRLCGPAIAADLILTARKVGAPEALALGLVSRVAKQGHALEDALTLARAVAANGPRAVRSALQVIRGSASLPLEEAMAVEADLAAELIAAGECVHGITAFLTRRAPVFPDVERDE